jgi:hydroxymethylpyrimidine/phosphomethylpyrimidine kinase
MVSTSGARLLEEDAVAAMRERIIPLAAVATPNAPEAGVLTGSAVRSLDEASRAAEAIHAMGAKVVIVKGGDVEYESGTVCDVVFDGRQMVVLRVDRLASGNTHGSGCALAAAIAVGLGRGLAPRDAIEMARRFVRSGIETSVQVGRGPGPVNHLRAHA